LNEIQVMIRRIRDLAVQSANDTNTDEDRANLQAEVTQLLDEINRIATTTQFNGMELLDGSFTGKVFHIGANADQTLIVQIGDMKADTLGIGEINISTQDGAESAIPLLDEALDTVSSQRSDLGAVQNRLEHTINNLQVAAENLTAAESRIRDVDVALETTNFVKNQILVQAATAMLAQANVKPQSVLQLLG